MVESIASYWGAGVATPSLCHRTLEPPYHEQRMNVVSKQRCPQHLWNVYERAGLERLQSPVALSSAPDVGSCLARRPAHHSSTFA